MSNIHSIDNEDLSSFVVINSFFLIILNLYNPDDFCCCCTPNAINNESGTEKRIIISNLFNGKIKFFILKWELFWISFPSIASNTHTHTHYGCYGNKVIFVLIDKLHPNQGASFLACKFNLPSASLNYFQTKKD